MGMAAPRKNIALPSRELDSCPKRTQYPLSIDADPETILMKQCSTKRPSELALGVGLAAGSHRRRCTADANASMHEASTNQSHMRERIDCSKQTIVKSTQANKKDD